MLAKDPLAIPEEISRGWKAAEIPGLPQVFSGGWVGYVGYDTVRYTYPNKLGFDRAPEDDLGLLDMHLGLYRDTVVFDNAARLIYAVSWADVRDKPTREAYDDACHRV
jgi:anthranilate synthase component 1